MIAVRTAVAAAGQRCVAPCVRQRRQLRLRRASFGLRNHGREGARKICALLVCLTLNRHALLCVCSLPPIVERGESVQ